MRQRHGKHQRGTTHPTLAHRIAEGMHTGLVQVQSAKDLNKLSGISQDIAWWMERNLNSTKCYAASWVENNFLWPRRFMTLLEIHLQQDCKCCAAALGVAIWATIGPNNQNSLEETFWHLATTTSTPAPVWWAKTSAAPKTSKLPLHGGWYRTGTVCHWPWNVKSRIRKSRASPTQTWIALEKLVQPRVFTFLQCTSSIEDDF